MEPTPTVLDCEELARRSGLSFLGHGYIFIGLAKLLRCPVRDIDPDTLRLAVHDWRGRTDFALDALHENQSPLAPPPKPIKWLYWIYCRHLFASLQEAHS